MVTFNLVHVLQWAGVIICVLAAVVCTFATGVQLLGSIFSRKSAFDWRDWIYPVMVVILLVLAAVLAPVNITLK